MTDVDDEDDGADTPWVPLERHGIHQYKKVRAKFAPKRTDDLSPDYDHEYWIGREADWRASWIIEDGQFQGDWAMVMLPSSYNSAHSMGWVPLCDLEIVE